MRYALNLSEDGRVLSAAYEDHAPEGSVLVDGLPEGDISDYLYLDGAFVHSPLPKEEPDYEDLLPVTWAEIHAAYEEGVMSA